MLFRRCRLCFILSLGLICISAVAQTPATQAAATQPGPTTLPVSLSDIVARSDQAASALRDIDAKLSADPITQTVEDQIELFTRDLSGRLEETERLLQPGASLETIRSQQADYDQFQKQLKSWQDDLLKRQKDLNLVAWQLTNEIGANLNLAVAEAAAANLGAEIRNDLTAALSEIARRQTRVTNELDRIDKVYNRVHTQKVKVDAELETIRTASARAWDRILDQDSDPLWRAILGRQEGQNLSDAGRTSFTAQWTTVTSYVQRNRANFLLHFAVMMMLAAGMIWMRRRMREWVATDVAVQRATLILQMPIAVAVVVTIIFSPWIYPQAPRLFWAIFGTLALLPTIYVLRRLVEKPLIPLFYALVVWCLLSLVVSVTASLPALSRLIFVLQMLGGAGFFICFLRSTRKTRSSIEGVPESTEDRLLWRVTIIGARVAIVTTIVAAVANIFGYVSLSRLLGAAIFTSAYLGVLLDATVRVVDAILLGVSHLYPFDSLGMMRRHREMLLRRAHYVVVFAAIFLWGYFTLDSVSLRNGLMAHVHGVLNAPWSAVQFPNITLGKILQVIEVITGAFLLSRFINFLLDEDVYPRLQLARGVPYAVSTLLRYVILLIGFIAAVSKLGYEATQLTILVSAFGVGLGFGMQNIVNNFVSGLILLFERPVQVGDIIQVDDMTGVVSRIGIRASVIRTHTASEIIVPNGSLISNKVINWTLSNRQRGIDIPLSLVSPADPKHVIDLLIGLAKAHPMVAASPTPQAYFVDFVPGGMKFELRVWTNRYEDWTRMRSDLAIAINTMVVKEGLLLK